MEKRYLRVQGRAQVTARPDTVMISFRIIGQHKQYSCALDKLNQRVFALREELALIGIDRKELKTTDFGINPEYDPDSRRTILIGYEAHHNAVLRLPWNQEQLSAVLKAMSDSAAEARFSISFTVADPAPLQQEARKKAVHNARMNAETLAEAAGVRLGGIIEISYGRIEVEIRSQLRMNMVCEAAEFDAEPDDVETEDSVTITWMIEC